MKLKEEDVPGAILLREKPEECIVKKLQLLPWSQNNRKENAVRTKVTARGPEVPEVFSAQKTHGCWRLRTFHGVIHKLLTAASLVPPNNPINERASSLGPRLSLFSAVSYNRLLKCRE